MASYQTITSSQRQNLNWDDPSAWTGGVVPNAADADVTVTAVPGIRANSPVTATILPGEAFQVRSVAGGGILNVGGTLAVSGALTVSTRLAGGTVSAGSANQDIIGYGTVAIAGSLAVPNVASFYLSAIGDGVESSGGALSVTTGSLDNGGALFANGAPLTITVTGGAGAFSQLSGGTLLPSGSAPNASIPGVTGTYLAANGGTLSLNVGGTVATDAASVVIGSTDEAAGAGTDTIQFFDPGTGTYQPLQATLQAVTGRLTIVGSQSFAAINPLTISGAVALNKGGQLSAPSVTLAQGGALSGSGTVGGTVVDNGTITSSGDATSTGRLILSGPVSGSGTVVVGSTYNAVASNPARNTIELGDSASVGVVFSDGRGTLQLDRPGAFTGTVQVSPGTPTVFPATASTPVSYDQVILKGIPFASVTGYSYAGSGSSGTLTIQQGAVQQTLSMVGALSTASFVLSAGPQASDLAITVTPLPDAPTPVLQPGTSFQPAGLIVNSDALAIGGFTSAGTSVTVSAGGSTVAADTSGVTSYTATVLPALSPGLQQVAVAVTASNAAGSTQVTSNFEVYRLPTAANGVTTADINSFDVSLLLGQGYRYSLASGTQALQLTNGTLSLGTRTTQAVVSTLYSALLHRSPDPAGLGYFSSQINDGVSVGTVAQVLLDSPEGSQNGMGTEPVATFVLQLYHSFLNRDPSAAEQAYYVNTINSGVSRGEVVATFATSPEATTFRDATAQYYAHLWSLDPNAALVTQLYETGLGREASQAETQAWVQQLVFAGLTPQQFAQDVAVSTEFRQDHDGQSPQDFVTSLYRAGLGRTPASSEVAGWINQINAGSPPAATLLGIGNSAEASGRLSPSV